MYSLVFFLSVLPFLLEKCEREPESQSPSNNEEVNVNTQSDDVRPRLSVPDTMNEGKHYIL